jgi:hypothetical protein
LDVRRGGRQEIGGRRKEGRESEKGGGIPYSEMSWGIRGLVPASSRRLKK